MLDTLVKVLISAALIAALAWFGGRLLGIRQSWGRGLVASVLGVGAAAILALAVAPQNPLPNPLFFLLIILLPSLLISMALSALLELLVEPGPLIRVVGRLTRVPHPIRAIRRWYERERRYSHITWIAARHGLAGFLMAREALGVAGDIGLAHLVEGRLQVRIDQRGIGHGTLLGARTPLPR